MSSLIPKSMNLTLAAYYGDKPDKFVELIRFCQQSVANELPGVFRQYSIEQVHATIVGLEGRCVNGLVRNDNYYDLGSSKNMDLKGLLDYLIDTPLLPFRVRIGGFRITDTFDFKSRDQHPYLRTIGIQPTSIVVGMGWPVQEADGQEDFPNTLNDFRREFNRFNVIHKYHKEESGYDNDFFFVVGKVDPPAASKLLCDAACETIRVRLAAIDPVYLDVRRENISIVAYVNNELPLATSVSIPIIDARKRINELERLHQDAT